MAGISRSLSLILLAAAAMLFTVGSAACGTSLVKRDRFEWTQYDKNAWQQEKDGVLVENRPVTSLPATFVATTQACTQDGRLIIDQAGAKVMERISVAQPGQIWYQVAITNNNDNIIRLDRAVIRLTDPAGNMMEPLSKDDVNSLLLAARPCPSTHETLPTFASIKMLTRNAELLPGTTTTAWLAFKPANIRIPGVWKLTLYEIPTATNDAGDVSRRTQFELRTLRKRFIDTYEVGMFKSDKLVNTEEVTN